MHGRKQRQMASKLNLRVWCRRPFFYHSLLLVVVLLAGALIPLRSVHALGQRTAVIYIRAIAADLELTPEQVESLTPQQVAAYILQEYPSIPIAKLKEVLRYWPGIKIMLHNDSVERQTTARLVIFKQRIESAYPDAVGLQTEYARDRVRPLLPLLYGEVDPNAL